MHESGEEVKAIQKAPLAQDKHEHPFDALEQMIPSLLGLPHQEDPNPDVHQDGKDHKGNTNRHSEKGVSHSSLRWIHPLPPNLPGRSIIGV